MAIVMGQAAVGTSVTQLVTLPPGSTAVFSCTGAALTLGTSNAITTTTGLALAVGATVSIAAPKWGQPVTIWAVGVASSVASWAVSD